VSALGLHQHEQQEEAKRRRPAVNDLILVKKGITAARSGKDLKARYGGTLCWRKGNLDKEEEITPPSHKPVCIVHGGSR